MRLIIALTFGLCICCAGCAINSEPLERSFQQAMTDVVRPALEQASKELTSRTAQIQGQGSLINPGYRMTAVGIVGTGFIGEWSLNAEGVSANIAGATQSDSDIKELPVVVPKDAATKPVNDAPE